MESISQGAIYLIENTVSRTVYIGQTMAMPARRWAEHRSALRNGYHRNPHLQVAYNKYGADAFEFCVLETPSSLDATNEAEQFYIQYFRSLGIPLYNHKSGGQNGGKQSDETKAKIRAKKLGTKASEETRAKMRARRPSEETRAKMSAARKGRKHTDATKAKMGTAWRGRKHTEESKAKQRAVKLGIKPSAETRAKRSAATKGRPKSDEWKAKMRGRTHSDASRSLMSEIQTARYTKNYVFRSPDGVLVRVNTQTELATRYGLRAANVSAIVRGSKKTHLGWSFVGFEE